MHGGGYVYQLFRSINQVFSLFQVVFIVVLRGGGYGVYVLLDKVLSRMCSLSIIVTAKSPY